MKLPVSLTATFLSLFHLLPVSGQDLSPEQISILEAFVEENDEVISFDELYLQLEEYLINPLHLNAASQEDLYEFGLLTDVQIRDFINYRTKNGRLVSLYELQAIRSFDLATIQRIVSFVTVEQIDPVRLRNGRNQLLFRWSRHLQESRGYLNGAYQGDPENLYLRYTYSVPRSMSLNLTAERDAGEPFFQGKNSAGFDFYSGHLAIERLTPHLEKIVVGDYALSFGQGLLIYNGFAPSKSAFVNLIRRGGAGLRPYKSKGEVLFQRGAALQVGLGPKWQGVAFASVRNRDASTLDQDTTDELLITTVRNSGIHRTEGELSGKNQIELTTIGGRIGYEHNRFRAHANFLSDRVDQSFADEEQLYQQFNFGKRHLQSASLDYSWQIRNLLLFGETAHNFGGSFAHVHGALVGLGRDMDVSVLYRSYPRDFFSYHAAAFGETRSVSNETGLYFGLEYRPLRQLTISTYLDFWSHPWLRFRLDRPSEGNEFLLRISYEERRKYSTYLQVKAERKDQNGAGGVVDHVVPVDKHQVRWQLNLKLNQTLEWRSRIEYAFYKKATREERGFLIYQDFIFLPLEFPFAVKGRIAFFDTPGYDSRIYMYENDVAYSFSIPPFFYKGLRYYLYLRYKGVRNVNLESRFAVLKYINREVVGSTLDEIPGPVRSTLSFQIRYDF
jgi:hypothetical protein